MKNYLYLTTAVIGVSMVTVNTTSWAQCLSSQDCAALGYTEASCSNGGVKCPFGNKWACFKPEDEYEQEFCTKYGFTLKCNGDNQIGGASKSCNGKYNVCSCADNYVWKDNACQKPLLNGAQDNLFYCKGIVTGVKAPGMDFYVSIKKFGKMAWDEGDDICETYSFCDNIYGTTPSAQQLLTIYNNKYSIDSLLSTNGGEQLVNGYHWASEYYGYDMYYAVDMSDGTKYPYRTAYENYVRPILVLE